MRKTAVGIVHQMEYEEIAADQLGITWTSRIFCPYEESSNVVVAPSTATPSWISFKREFFIWLNNQVPKYDLILLRYSMNDPFQSLFIARCTIPVVTMHHTLDIPELRSYNTSRGNLLALLETNIGRISLRNVKGVAAVTNEIAQYQKARSRTDSLHTFHYSNGAVYGANTVIQSDFESSDHEFLYLSSHFYPWMGLDLLVRASEKSEKSYKIHIVGRLKDVQKEELNKDQRFVAHGPLGRHEIEKLISKCTIGLSTFAIERKNFTEGNTLKVMEYLKSGLPVYAGYKDIFDASFPYYKQGPANMDAIIEYADKVRNVDRKLISNSARPIIDKKIVLNRFYGELREIFSDSN